jgi:hypothetical protein
MAIANAMIVINSNVVYELDENVIVKKKRNKQEIIELLKKRIDRFRMIEKRIINRGENLPISHMKSPSLVELLKKSYHIDY